MFNSKPKFRVYISRDALESVFDECDQFDFDETGGRLIGAYTRTGDCYDVEVQGVIGPGPNARRSATSFFQDGEYQERIFRHIESRNSAIEHLGNWHTHHVNGLETLSSGDLRTYRSTLNHPNHNVDFFYALLVTRKRSDRRRYDIRHYFFRRNDDGIYEVPERQVRITERHAIWTRAAEQNALARTAEHGPRHAEMANLERPKDVELFSTLYPSLKSLFSSKAGALYWKGPLELIDGSRLEIVALETATDGHASYSVTAATERQTVAEVLNAYRERTFSSARQAVTALERDINRALYGEALRKTNHEHCDR
jgi:hypothetical protein